jgi:adenylate kinase family enzyme
VRVIFLSGSTSCGKGTRATRIAERTAAKRVSNGNLVCAGIKPDSDLGKGHPATPTIASLRIGHTSNSRDSAQFH